MGQEENRHGQHRNDEKELGSWIPFALTAEPEAPDLLLQLRPRDSQPDEREQSEPIAGQAQNESRAGVMDGFRDETGIR